MIPQKSKVEEQSGTDNVHQLITETVPMFFFVYDIPSRRVEYVSNSFLEYVTIDGNFSKLDPHRQLEFIISEEDKEKFNQFFEDLSKENRYKASVELRTPKEKTGIDWIEINTFKASKKSTRAKKVVGHILDISFRKKQNEILNKENERLENFINMMAHDLKAPLANLSLVVDLMRGSMSPAEMEKYRKYLDILHATTRDSGELISKLLHFATLKGEASKLDLHLHDLRKVVRGCVDSEKTRITEKNLKISFDFPDYAVEALLDITLFKQVILNLLGNAIKFTPKGGEIKFSSGYTEDDHISLCIRDSGIGIPEQYIPTLFKNTSIIKRDGLEGEKSTGLGLYICLQIMRIHRGRISVSSKENEGSTFILHLPIPGSSSAYL